MILVSDHNHPTRMSLVPWIHAACALHMARINMLAHDRSCLISIGACNLGHSGFGGSAFVKCSLGHQASETMHLSNPVQVNSGQEFGVVRLAFV